METVAISVNQDNFFSKLREAAMTLLHDQVGDAWTDHNLHDPGITIIESLCYAISEFRLKSRLDILELLGNINKDPEWPDFLGKDTLFNCALTETDYRKLLLNHTQVKNAWLGPFLCPKELYYDDITKLLVVKNPSAEKIPIHLKGLNRILLELESVESDISLPATDIDLNNNIISRQSTILPSGILASFDIAFPFWDEAPIICGEGLQMQHFPGIQVSANVTAVPLSFLATLNFSLLSGGSPVAVEIGVYVNIIPLGLPITAPESELIAAIEALLEDDADGAPVPVFLEKMKRTKKEVDDLIAFLHLHRNLSEDHTDFKIVRTQEIAVEVDLRITSFVPAELVLARLYREMDRWLSPDIPFYTEAELTAVNWTVDRIFEGPDLGGHFLDETDFPEADQGGSIRVSDLVGMFMKTEGVDALEEFSISNYINNLAVTSHEHNCLSLVSPRLYKPRFSRAKSLIRVFQDGILRTPVKSLIDNYENELAATEIYPTLPVSVTTLQEQIDRTVEIGAYYSIQHEFPSFYGLKEGELSMQEGSLRKAQSRQLKAYLAHFEQLLANYGAQLGGLREIFSIGPGITTTYPSQPLYEVPGIAEVLQAFSTGTAADWANFKNDNANAYAIAMANTDSKFINRRHRFLDHLLARLGHSPEDLTALRVTPIVNVEERIIEQKRRFIQKFPEISSERGKAFCHQAAQNVAMWDTDNVSGLEKRIAHLLDIPDFKRQDLGVLGALKEGFFLIEHILLRPLDIEPSPIPCLLPEAWYMQTSSISAWHTDPYSFRITFVFPALSGRFAEEEFQRKTERILALETPAHIFWDAYWITVQSIQFDFENVLHAWLDIQSLPMPVEEPARDTYLSQWSDAKAAVIKYLNHFRKFKYSTDIPPRNLTPPFHINTAPPP